MSIFASPKPSLPLAAVSPELVKRLYDEVLCGESVARIQLLETSKYLEK